MLPAINLDYSMLSQHHPSRGSWLPWILVLAGFWLSSNLVIDLLVMPVMQVSGMTTQTEFASAGYMLFWWFNRLELVCAAILLTGLLARRRHPGEFDIGSSSSRSRWALALGLALLSLALVDTYLLAPEMSAMAVSLDSFSDRLELTPAMNWLHGFYWLLETVKVAGLGLLARLCYLDLRASDSETSTTDILV